MFNIEKYVNEMIEYTYGRQLFGEGSYYLPYNIVKEIKLDESLKKFYIERAYEADLEQDIIVYFINGYCVDEQADVIQKNNISLMFVSDNEYNTARVYLYNDVYKDMFRYDKDISKTEIIKTSGLKIEKSNSEVKSRDQITIEDEYFQNKNVNEHISEVDLITRYVEDYKINKAIENGEKLSSLSISYDGNFDEGYTIKENNGKEYFIKPGNIPMDYEAVEK